MQTWLEIHTLLGIAALDWLIAFLAAVISYLLLVNLLKFVTARLDAMAQRSVTRFDDILVYLLKKTNPWTLRIAALLIGSHFLGLNDKWLIRIDHMWFLLIGFQGALWISSGVTLWTTRRMADQSSAFNPVLTTMIAGAFRVFLWTILLLAVLANMGVNITAFVASLGVGGVAVALAVQSILSDLFASLSIGLDKPFEVGDFIVFDPIAGSIERIGLKTTRIRSLSGEEVVCSNTELLKNTIHNYKRMEQRRIVFSFGLTYDTTPEQLRAVPGIVKAAVDAAGTARYDRAHFKEFGDSSLNFEVVFIVESPEFNLYMDIQQSINLTLMTEFTARGIDFAFPTRTLHIAGRPEFLAATPGDPITASSGNGSLRS